MAMTRQQAIDHIWSLSNQVDQEFCCSKRESDELEQETVDAIAALTVQPLVDAWDQGFAACQLGMSKAILGLLPKVADTTNPYAKAVPDAED